MYSNCRETNKGHIIIIILSFVERLSSFRDPQCIESIRSAFCPL